ncbi:UDP-N-acetylmuramate dehydrogenase [Patescibacteria group bacterium]|nr:UDP-N-acetylmuramate dehydrogenase [Patescibacteria group bacterium]
MLEIKENEILADHSTFKIGGPAKYFASAKNKEEILEAIDFAKNKNLPYFVLAGGSNILFRDEGYNGVIIQIKNLKFKIKNSIIEVTAGLPFSKLIMDSIEAELTGLEWGVGIPGTIGGCVAGNCGAYGHSISESVIKIKTLEKEYLKEECDFKYRASKFKSGLEIILEIELKLEKGNKEKSQEEIKDILTKRREKIPPYPSIGSIFKNPKPLIAKELIEQCGLKGQRINGAQISEQHANFIVNVGNAKAQDVLGLINLCQSKVKEKFNIDLGPEIVIL